MCTLRPKYDKNSCKQTPFREAAYIRVTSSFGSELLDRDFVVILFLYVNFKLKAECFNTLRCNGFVKRRCKLRLNSKQ